MTTTTRLRQVALVARRLDAVADAFERELGLGRPFHDPGVARFGLENSVWAVGDTFLEVVAPVEEGTTAGRYLDRRGGDSGYMAIFQVPDLASARQRIDGLGVRVVWEIDHDGYLGNQLHPRDLPGAIVSVDQTTPPEAWPPAGPDWIGGAPERSPGGITGVTVQAPDPAALAARWAEVLGLEVAVGGDGTAVVRLDDGRQELRFVGGAEAGQEAIVGVGVAVPEGVRSGRDDDIDICGVRFHLHPAPAEEATT